MANPFEVGAISSDVDVWGTVDLNYLVVCASSQDKVPVK